MKRFIAVLSGLLVLPAFAEVAPIYYDEVIEYSDTEDVADIDAADAEIDAPVVPVVQSPAANPRSAASTRKATRAVPANANASTRAAGNRAVASSRKSSSNNSVQARTAAQPTRSVSGRAPTRAARSATGGANKIVTTRRAMQATPSKTAARASIIQTDTVNTPLYTGRVSTRAAAVRARIPTISTVGNTTTTKEVTASDTADVAASMDELAQMTDFCKAQYTQCMDNFCNVLDDNQGRCSCSKNIKNYEKTETALKEATIALQDVAQQIQYIGLTGDEVETLFEQTEAEIGLQGASDNSQIKNNLDKIKDMIVEAKSGTATSTETGFNFDLNGLLDFSFNSAGFDLMGIFGNTTTNTNSISNQRGEQLYKTATARCKASVLTECQAQGVDISVITNSYDLEIDKQCIAYERALTDSNDEMSQTVRNAKSVLQRARLMVAQQKNAYDLRGCISALDSCMQDDYVCGSDYELCLDPTGKYIVNGEVVVGSTPGYVLDSADKTAPAEDYSADTLMSAWYYDGEGSNKLFAWGASKDKGTLADYIGASVKTAVTELKGDSNMAEYLQYKIGYNADGKNHGMCMSVLNKCQDITYEDGEYVPDNQVVKEYLSRTLVQIKAAQDEILADYAESCITDVSSCLSSNNFDMDASDAKKNIAINACRSQIKTCMSVNGNTAENPSPESIKNWIMAMMCDDGYAYNIDTKKCEKETK